MPHYVGDEAGEKGLENRHVERRRMSMVDFARSS